MVVVAAAVEEVAAEATARTTTGTVAGATTTAGKLAVVSSSGDRGWIRGSCVLFGLARHRALDALLSMLCVSDCDMRP